MSERGSDLIVGEQFGGGAQPAPGLRVAVLGISVRSTCGVRDHAGLLAEELAREGMSCSFHWLLREERSLRGVRREVSAWRAALAVELERERPDLLLVHYSVFSYSFKGVPLFVAPAYAALRRTGTPTISILHEFAYPWRYGGWRGAVWAVTQRALMVEVMRSSAAVLVTAEGRAAWLNSRPWLARRPVSFAPVYSNLPAPTPAAGAHSEPGSHVPTIGLFGYAYQGAAVALVLDALETLVRSGSSVRLRLLGSPGPDSEAGTEWRAAAAARGLGDRLSFSGRLSGQELSDALAGCELLLAADASGPSSRKGTLAGSLASGSPLIAIDGPQRWGELVRSGAIRVVAPAQLALAAAIGELLGDPAARADLGARGRAFAEQRMGVARTAQAVGAVLRQIAPRFAAGRPAARSDGR